MTSMFTSFFSNTTKKSGKVINQSIKANNKTNGNIPSEEDKITMQDE